MSKYDGLIIPRAWNEYINKSDPIALNQALQGLMDNGPTENSTKPAKSGGIYSAITAASEAQSQALTEEASARASADNALAQAIAAISFDSMWPIGSVYTQYPKCADPNTLWGDKSTWEELQFYGHFFRASGGNADAFIESGSLNAQSAQIMTHFHPINGNNTSASGTDKTAGFRGVAVNTGGMSQNKTGYIVSGGQSGICGSAGGAFSLDEATTKQALNDVQTVSTNLYKTAVLNVEHTHSVTAEGYLYGSTDVNAPRNLENRPANYTIKIWKRTA